MSGTLVSSAFNNGETEILFFPLYPPFCFSMPANLQNQGCRPRIAIMATVEQKESVIDLMVFGVWHWGKK